MKNATGVALAAALMSALVGPAAAADYIAVRPEKFRGQEFDVGQKVQIGAGQALTLMHASGDVTQRWGDPAGWATIPPHPRAPAESDLHMILRVLISSPPSGLTIGGRRGTICPSAAELQTIASIAAAAQAGNCEPAARTALQAYVDRQVAAQQAPPTEGAKP